MSSSKSTHTCTFLPFKTAEGGASHNTHHVTPSKYCRHSSKCSTQMPFKPLADEQQKVFQKQIPVVADYNRENICLKKIAD